MRVMVCGGAGYIGSHACVVLCERGHEVIVVDNFSNSPPEALARLEGLVGHALEAHCVDIRDGAGLSALFSRQRYDAVVHVAALTSAADACERPLEYFDNNIAGTISLLRSMRDAGVGKLIFSSAAIAGAVAHAETAIPPFGEDALLSRSNPYCRTACMVEQLIDDVCSADPGLRAVSLRYFHTAGAHPSGRIGDLCGTAADPLHAISQTAAGLRECVQIYGNDWPTSDGTCVRDYLHVMDLARAHADALDALNDDAREAEGGHLVLNLGRGVGVSVLQLLRGFEAATGREIPYRVLARRVGDVAETYADPQRAQRWLGWRAELGVDAICRDTWRRQTIQLNDDALDRG